MHEVNSSYFAKYKKYKLTPLTRLHGLKGVDQNKEPTDPPFLRTKI